MKKFFSKIAQRAFALAISIMVVTNTFAQGAAGIDAASSELATYMDPLGNMMMILGGLVGLVGAVRVYLKWNSGDALCINRALSSGSGPSQGLASQKSCHTIMPLRSQAS